MTRHFCIGFRWALCWILRWKFELGGSVPIGPVQLLDFDNINILLQSSSIWRMFPGTGTLRDCVARKLLEELESGGSSWKIIQMMKRLGCAKSCWGRRNTTTELPSALTWVRLLQAARRGLVNGEFLIEEKVQGTALSDVHCLLG